MRLRVTFRVTRALPMAALGDSQLPERHAGKKRSLPRLRFSTMKKPLPYTLSQARPAAS
jgi:hypothetical protein